jgi:hypothetical protein
LLKFIMFLSNVNLDQIVLSVLNHIQVSSMRSTEERRAII